MTTREKTINIATDFSSFPIGRFTAQSPNSGESFREKILKNALNEFDKVYVNLDDTEGYGSSFLEEAFGGLIRKGYFTLDDLKKRLIINANGDAYKHYVDQAWQYIKRGRPEK